MPCLRRVAVNYFICVAVVLNGNCPSGLLIGIIKSIIGCLLFFRFVLIYFCYIFLGFRKSYFFHLCLLMVDVKILFEASGYEFEI